jgi:hypothetical protein
MLLYCMLSNAMCSVYGRRERWFFLLHLLANNSERLPTQPGLSFASNPLLFRNLHIFRRRRAQLLDMSGLVM